MRTRTIRLRPENLPPAAQAAPRLHFADGTPAYGKSRLICVKTSVCTCVHHRQLRILGYTMNAPASFTREQLLASARGELFGPDSGRLPNDPMLMFDRITEIREDGGTHGKGMIRAELDIHPDLWFFQCHFLGDPVMPGCLGLDAMWQLTGFFLTWIGAPGRGRALGSGEVKFTGQVLPSAKKVSYEIDISRVINRKLVLAVADARMLVDGREIYTARDLRVGLFTSTESF